MKFRLKSPQSQSPGSESEVISQHFQTRTRFDSASNRPSILSLFNRAKANESLSSCKSLYYNNLLFENVDLNLSPFSFFLLLSIRTWNKRKPAIIFSWMTEMSVPEIKIKSPKFGPTPLNHASHHPGRSTGGLFYFQHQYINATILSNKQALSILLSPLFIDADSLTDQIAELIGLATIFSFSSTCPVCIENRDEVKERGHCLKKRKKRSKV